MQSTRLSDPTGFFGNLVIPTKLADLDSNTNLLGITLIAGITSHIGYFLHGEHHRGCYQLVKTYVALEIIIAGLLIRKNGHDLTTSAIQAAIVTAGYLLGLFGAMGLYRGFFHPLRRIPGPFLARFSNLYHSSLLGNSDNYRVIYNMHKEHGPIVRTGPSNLSLNAPEAVQLLYGPDSQCGKTAWYEVSRPLQNLHTVRDKKVHETRRKVWARAFSPKSLVEYDGRIAEYSELLCRQLTNLNGKPFDATRWFKYYAWDVMGELGFGKGFEMLENGKNRHIPDLLEEGMAHIAQLQVVPWLVILLHKLPFAAKGPKQFAMFFTEKAMSRVKEPPNKPDVLRYLVDHYNNSPKADTDFQWLRGDTRLFVVGGSDTTASTLTHIMYYLAKYPEQLAKLRAELEPLLVDRTTLDPKDVGEAKHLNGIIHEVLRLHPPIPSGFPRLTPEEGIVVDGTYIPGGTTVTVPLWVMGRSEEVYESPLEFIPERWYSRPEMIKHKNTFAAFGLGPYGCIGRALALMEMRNVICHILSRFESIEMAPCEDGSSLMNLTKDHFTAGISEFQMVFKAK
ncbi:Cytochrome P450 [Penicillium cf. griseofulvum]|nr:Cytochrome P450 [Penicillium cf. griseofulvum]